MSGLLCARVLADHFDEVRILERDEFPAIGETRKGVPQGRHAHALLASGLSVLEELFAGFTAELMAQGALKADPGRDARWFIAGGYHARATGIDGLLVSRPRLEAHVRSRVAQLPNVHIESRSSVQSLEAADGNRVVGVRVRDADRLHSAALVVDATGRGSKTPAWLAALGFPKPEEESVRVDLGYSSRVYRRSPGDIDGDLAAVIVPHAPGRRGAVMFSMEDDRWIVTLIGMLGDHPPTDDDGFLAFARSLPAPDIYETIAQAEPLTSPTPFGFPASRRRRYDLLQRFPRDYLVFGDALCSFNPIYGQGMSVAALQAKTLQGVLASGLDDLAPRFFRAITKVWETPWSITVGGDLQYPEVEGPRTLQVKFVNWYLEHLHIAARREPALALAFQRVSNLIATPRSLLMPNVVLRVLRGRLCSAP